jgi:hypothetical protein
MGGPGIFDVQGDAELLTFQIANGRWVVVQASAALGSNSAELAQFCQRRASAGQRNSKPRLSPGLPGSSRPSVQVGLCLGRPR